MGVVKNGCGFLGPENLRSAVSPEWINELSLFLTRSYKFRKANSLYDKFWVVWVILGTLKSTMCQEWFWFFACWYKFMKAKSYFNDFRMGVVKNGLGLWSDRTVKSAYLKNKFKNWVDFVHADTNSWKLKLTVITWAGEVKKRYGFLGDRTLKSVVSQEWIDELRWFCAWWYKFMKSKSYFSNFRWQNSKICHNSRMNWLNEQIFSCS